MAWEEYRGAAQTFGDGIRKAKAKMKLNLARDAENHEKGS